MADFEKAIHAILSHEGGFVDHPSDPGGATNWGISTRWLRQIGDGRDVRSMTRDEAVKLYRVHFWDRYGYGDIKFQTVAEKVFDATVNMGPGWGHRVLQRALRAIGHSHVKDDGVLGPVTLQAIRILQDDFPLVTAMRSEQAGRYREIVARDPSKAVFLKGWLRRAYGEIR